MIHPECNGRGVQKRRIGDRHSGPPGRAQPLYASSRNGLSVTPAMGAEGSPSAGCDFGDLHARIVRRAGNLQETARAQHRQRGARLVSVDRLA